MHRRTFLQATTAAWLGAGASEPAPETRSAPDSSTWLPSLDGPGERWFLDWLPRALLDRGEGYGFGTYPTPLGEGGVTPDGDAYLRLVAPHARLEVAVGTRRRRERRRVERAGYDRLDASGANTLYGQAIGRRYRGVAVAPDGVVRGTGPAADPVLAAVTAVAGTDGPDEAAGDDLLFELLDHVGPVGRLSVERRPVEGVAGAAEGVVSGSGSDRVTVRTVAVPGTDGDRAAAHSYIGSHEGGGVGATRTERRGQALVCETEVADVG